MNYYNDNNYYQHDMSMSSDRSPQPYYPYENEYRHVDQGRYNNKPNRSSRRNGRVSTNNMYYEEPSSQSSYSGYYENDRPLMNYRSSYYNKHEDQAQQLSPYFMTSPDQQYQERVYAPKKNNSSRKSRNYKQKYNDYPITPEEGNNNFYYNNNDFKEERINAVENEIYANYNNNTGAETLTAAFHDNNNSNEREEEEEEEEECDPKTQMNTMFNAESNMMSTDHIETTTASSIHSLTTTLNDTIQQQQQQQQRVTPNQFEQSQQSQQQKKKWFMNVAQVFKKNVKKFTKKEMIAKEGGSSLPTSSSHSPAIQFITAKNNELLGDVLDAEQEKDILSQLSSNNTPMSSSSFNMSPEKTKITNLDRIWVFRLIDPTNTNKMEEKPIAWIGFDYENQIKIENHLKELPNLPENERFAIFYDSHIRHQKMPVIVTPNESKGYYFANEEQTDLIILQVTFIENNHQKVTFVYRV